MGQLTKYAFANAKIRAMLSRLLAADFFDTLLSVPDFSAAAALLRKTQYAPVFEKADPGPESMVRLEDGLNAFDEEIFRKAASFLMPGEKRFVLLLLEKFEIEALKKALRIWQKKPLAGKDNLLPGRRIIHAIDYAKIVQAQSIEELIVLLAETPYFRALARGREKFKEQGSPASLFYLEAALDVDYYERLLAALAAFSPADQKTAGRILGIEIDIENINWLVRMRKYYNLPLSEMLDWFIPGGERVTKEAVRRAYSGDGLGAVLELIAGGPYAGLKELSERNLHFIENFLYQALLRQVKRSLAGFPFSIGTVLGYLTLKRRETRNIISILNAKRLGWKKDELYSLINL